MFAKITNNIPAITIILIIAGYYDLHTYYQKFGVNISSFLDPTEIIFAFSTIFQAVVSIIALFIFGALFASLIDQIQVKPNAENVKSNLNILVSSHEKLRKITIIGIIGLSVIFVLIILTVIILLDLLHISDFILLICLIALFSIYWFTTKIFQIKSNLKILRSHSFTIDQIDALTNLTKISTRDYAALVIVLLLYFNIRSEIRYRNVIEGSRKYAVRLEGTDQVKSKSEFYVGSTRNYTFMYDSLSKTVKSYPERDVKRTEVKELRIGI